MSQDDASAEEIIRQDIAAQQAGRRQNRLSIYTCPQCGGTLWQVGEGELVRFRCHAGHAYAAELLLVQQSAELESALWASIQLLQEKASLSRQLAARAEAERRLQQAARLRAQAELDERRIRLLHEQLLESETVPAGPGGAAGPEQ